MRNYHTHTRRCYHAIDSEEEYIINAIKAGYSELGFSDHTPWRYHSSFHSSMRMEEDKLEGYVKTLRRLKEKYKNDISIKIGLECEYFPEYMDWLKEIIDEYELDYIILGNHFDDSDETGIYFGRPLNKAQLKKYVDNCIKAIKTGLYSYVAHPDLAFFDTQDPYYHEQMKRLCLCAKEYQVPLEFNLLGYSTHRHYPSNGFLKIVQEVKNQMIIGVDAHESQALLNKDLYFQVKSFLESLNIEVIEDIRFFR